MNAPRGAKPVLTRLQRLYLSRRVCGWCDMPLHRDSCGAIYERCSTGTRAKRRARCLAQYKQRVEQAACGGGRDGDQGKGVAHVRTYSNNLRLRGLYRGRRVVGEVLV